MAQNVLKMKYHPAKKAVKFEALQDGIPFSNCTNSTLYHNYESRPFVLQQYGNPLFEAIRGLFNGAGSVNLEVTTTKTDYEDLEQMVEYYNRELAHQKSNFRIIPTLEAVLPDMDDVYKKVRDYGEKAVAILDYHRGDFYTINSDNKAVQESIKLFSENVQKEITNIQGKVTQMDDNNVNLCFAGIFSAGKSTLINAILGYHILPERIEPTTARSFRIHSPKNGEAIHIEFLLGDEHAILPWNEESNCLSFSKYPAENATIKAINDLLKNCPDAPRHEQIYQVLDYLNADDNVAPVIDVVFPVPLDRDTVQFTILDTPGTDSSTKQHGIVLRNALKEQESSILIFVAPANHAADGQGNRDLMDLLNNEGKAIDIDRSIFVINFADSVDSDQRKTLKSSKIRGKIPKSKGIESGKEKKDEEEFQIDLSSKKVFFTSAKLAYLAKAVRNNIATEKEVRKLKNNYQNVIDEDDGCYYQDNHCATSNCATDKMLKRCEAALRAAEGHQYQEVLICSGLFALEDEIIRYGEKYASAVRAHAIIDGVDQALVSMSGKAKSLKSKANADIFEIDAKIQRTKNALKKTLAEQAGKFALKNEKQLSKEVLDRLHLSEKCFGDEVYEPAEKFVKGKLGFFQKVKFSEKQRDEIAKEVAAVLGGFEKKYVECRKTELENIQNKFIHNVRKAIDDSGDIDPEARDYICDIEPPALKPFEIKKIRELYEGLKQSERFIIFRREFVKKDEFLSEFNKYLRYTQERIIREYAREFSNELNSILNATLIAYETNLEEYSLVLRAAVMDKKAMEELMEKINEAALDLQKCQDELDEIIWESANDEG